jgi:DNA-binding transcriptional ArsR family regulator
MCQYSIRLRVCDLTIKFIYRNIAIITMGSSKTSEFSTREKKIARYAKALAHPARVAIMQLLAKKQTCICGDIVDELPLSQSTVSQHLKELKEAGLIKGDVEGVRVCYCIDEKEWLLAKASMTQFFNMPVNFSKCC